MGGNSDVKLINEKGIRLDGRTVNDVRPVTIKAGVLDNAPGSAYVELGRNKVIVGVYGPREVFPKHKADPYKAVLRCIYRMAPFSTDEHGRTRPNRRSIEISKVSREALENVILTHLYPKTSIEIFIEILESHGSTRVAGVTAAAVALANAGVPMKDLPVGVSVGKIGGQIAVDMMKEEDNFGQSDTAMVFRPGNGDILLLQMDGKLTRAEFEKTLDMGFEAAKGIHKKQVAALTSLYESEMKETEAEAASEKSASPAGASASA